MSDQVHKWYARPVFYVADVNRAIGFYVGMLGFVKAWHEADGAGTVCQVNRSECEIILCQDAARETRAACSSSSRRPGLPNFAGELAERARAEQGNLVGIRLHPGRRSRRQRAAVSHF